jgi:hypothetical protein
VIGVERTRTRFLSGLLRHVDLAADDLSSLLDDGRLLREELLLQLDALQLVGLLDVLEVGVDVSDLGDSSQNLLGQVGHVVLIILVLIVLLDFLIFLFLLSRSRLALGLPGRLVVSTLINLETLHLVANECHASWHFTLPARRWCSLRRVHFPRQNHR